jgi:hypothetical protein
MKRKYLSASRLDRNEIQMDKPTFSKSNNGMGSVQILSKLDVLNPFSLWRPLKFRFYLTRKQRYRYFRFGGGRKPDSS